MLQVCRDGLYDVDPTLQVPDVSVDEAIGDPPTVLSFGFLMPCDRLALVVLRLSSSL